MNESVAGGQAALVPHEQQLSFAITLMEHLVVPTFVLDAEHRVLVWNRACERLTNILAADIVGTRDHWKAFYESPRPCLADLVAEGNYEHIADLYTVHQDPAQPTIGVHAENWCWMPHRHERLYLAVDAGPVYDESGTLIAVVETLRDITEKQIAQIKVIEQADILKAHYEQHEREAKLARRILDHQIRQDQMELTNVRYSVTPASNFSGDIVLAARAPGGVRYAMLADATGHGLAAAVSVLPMVQEFYRLVDLGEPLAKMIEAINFLLTNSLPEGRFVAAAFVRIDETRNEGEVWVGGIPDVLLLDASGKLLRRFSSNNLPLGIMRTLTGCHGVERFHWKAHCRLLMLSDGVIEMRNPAGEQFGDEALIAAIEAAPADGLIHSLHAALRDHARDEPVQDDMSLLVVDCPVQ